MDSYSRLAPFIREYIYQEKWSSLRNIQEGAIEEIFENRDHLLIASGTASGKTEAAFFPILSTLWNLGKENTPCPLALYISPLKALINDQGRRLERLVLAGKDTGAEKAIALARWHGDIPAGEKNRFLENPSGVLLITPESLESLLLRHGRRLKAIFGGLLFVIIDEVHVFMGSDRGSQLLCQLKRIEEAIPENPVRRVGLSATLGDYEGARRWLGQGQSTALLCDENPGRKLSIALDYSAGQDKEARLRTIYSQCRGKRTIVFTNSRLEAEECAASLKELARRRGEADIFRVHHGSVSALLRDEAEEELKAGEGPSVTCATATLELGIDIGGLDRIIQLGPPWSAAAFVQRLGRSGRRSGWAEIFFSVTGNGPGGPASNEAGGIRAIPWDLLRTMAVIQLYLEEKWIEPPEEKPLPYSLLIHQTLSILASLGEKGAEELAGTVLALPPFGGIARDCFLHLILWLTDCGIIEKTEGGLLLGLEGERIVSRHSFYSIFPGEEEFRVLLEGREVGKVNFAPAPGSVLVMGGRRWQVRSIDSRRREIWVEETGDGGSERLWQGRGGDIHERTAEAIRCLITKSPDAEQITSRYPYLSPDARAALENGRRKALELGLAAETLVSREEGPVTDILLFPWLGSRGMRTIAALLSRREYRKKLKINYMEQEPFYFHLETMLSKKEFLSALTESCYLALNAPDTIIPPEPPYMDKYDYLLPQDLLASQYTANALDLSALEKLRKAVSTQYG